MMPFPLNTMVLNVTNQCNLACTYCYEYGEDKIVDTEHGQQPKFMSEETARESVDFLLRESGRPGGAPDVLRRRDAAELPGAASRRSPTRAARAAEVGKEIDFSLTTNATLLQAGDHRVPRREPRRRHDLDRRPARAAGQVPRLPQRRRQLRRRRAEDQGAAARPPHAADRRARDADLGHARHHADLPASDRGDRVLGSRLRAGDDVAAAQYAIGERRLRSDARAVPRAGRRVPRARRRRTGITASRTSRTRSRRSTRASARRIRAARASACSACRPTATSRCAIASPAPTRTSSAPCATASTATRRARS